MGHLTCMAAQVEQCRADLLLCDAGRPKACLTPLTVTTRLRKRSAIPVVHNSCCTLAIFDTWHGLLCLLFLEQVHMNMSLSKLLCCVCHCNLVSECMYTLPLLCDSVALLQSGVSSQMWFWTTTQMPCLLAASDLPTLSITCV